MSDEWVIYGSYGYTGNLIAREAVERGFDPTLAGRNRTQLELQASELGCDFEVVGLDEPQVLEYLLEDATAVLHCAGPFVDTHQPMVDACLRTGTHYLDITGEIDVFRAIHRRDEEATDADVMLMPGVGFDVVPTDCMAAHVVDRLPDATALELAFEAEIGVSPGTAKTVVEGLDDGGRVRRDGRIERVRPAHETRTVDFDWEVGERTVAAIPWGDVATAHYTTGVPTVTVYAAMPPSAVRVQRIADRLAPLLGLEPVQSALKWLVDRTVEGPDDDDRAAGNSYVWAEARTRDGERAVSRLRCPHTYTTTVRTALAVARRVLDGDATAGYQTPAGEYGPDLILAIDGTEREDVL